MTAIIKPIGMLKTYTRGESMLIVETGQTILSALELLSIPTQLVALVMVNSKPQNKQYILENGDIVQIMAVIGGG